MKITCDFKNNIVPLLNNKITLFYNTDVRCHDGSVLLWNPHVFTRKSPFGILTCVKGNVKQPSLCLSNPTTTSKSTTVLTSTIGTASTTATTITTTATGESFRTNLNNFEWPISRVLWAKDIRMISVPSIQNIIWSNNFNPLLEHSKKKKPIVNHHF